MAALALLVVTVAGCDDHPSAGPERTSSEPTLEQAECPPEVDNVLMDGYSCAYLAVADGIKLLVTTIEPSSKKAPDPVIILGEDYGTALNYAGLAPVAERLGRTVYLLNPRGVAGSQPDLSCPEVDGVGGPDRTVWLAAVQQCHDRLVDSGVDLAAYGSDSMPGDVLALVAALGLDSWNLGNWGTSSVVTLRLLAQDPSSLRSVVLDSPAVPGDDPRMTLAGDTRRALRSLFDRCQADGACRHLPHTVADLDAAAESLDEAPLQRTLTVDGSMLVRLVRHALSDNGVTTPDLAAVAVPAILAGVSHWTASMDRNLLTPLTVSAPYCEGYLPTCKSFHRTTLGVLLTDLCRNHEPVTLPADDDAIGRFAATSPYIEACDSWDVERNDDAALPKLTSEVPVLAFVGEYDPYTDVSRVRAALAGMPNAHVIDVPGYGHNAISADPVCHGTIRQAFVDEPTAPLEDGCLADSP